MKKLLILLALCLFTFPCFGQGAGSNGPSAISSGGGDTTWEVDPNGGIKPVDDEVINAPSGMNASGTSVIAGDFSFRSNDDPTVGSYWQFSATGQYLTYYQNNNYWGRFGGNAVEWYNFKCNNAYFLGSHPAMQLRNPYVALHGSVGAGYVGLALYADDMDTNPTVFCPAEGRTLFNTITDDGVSAVQIVGNTKIGDDDEYRQVRETPTSIAIGGTYTTTFALPNENCGYEINASTPFGANVSAGHFRAIVHKTGTLVEVQELLDANNALSITFSGSDELIFTNDYSSILYPIITAHRIY